MTGLRLIGWLFIALSFAGSPVKAQSVDPNSDLGMFRDAREAGMTAFDRADYATALSSLEQARALAPDSPSVLLILGQVHVEMRNKTAARAVLVDYLKRGYVLDINKTPEFSTVWDQQLEDMLTANRSAFGRMGLVATLPGANVLEGLAYDLQSDSVYLSSVRTGEINVLAAQGPRKVIGFRPGVAAYGIAVHNGELWAATSASRLTAGYIPSAAITSKLLRINPSDGAILATVTDAVSDRSFGRILAGRDDLYVIDTAHAEVLRLSGYGNRLEVLVPEGYMDSPQALAESASGGMLMISDYVSGLYYVDLVAGRLGHLAPPADATLLGISHLSRYGNDLIAIQTGFKPNRVLRLHMSADWRSVARVEVLARSDRMLNQPTQAAVAGDVLVFIAQSQWDSLDDKGQLVRANPEPGVVAALPLAPQPQP